MIPNTIISYKEIMTLHDVAEYLQLNERSILKMAKTGEIPATKVMNQWRFMRSLINDWLMYKMEKLPPSMESDEADLDADKPLLELLNPKLMNFEIIPGAKSKILGQITFPMVEHGFLTRRKYFLNKLLDREGIMTTAIGHGVAVPHPRHPIAGLFPSVMVALGVCREGTYYDAPDKKPVKLFFTICASSDIQHLRILAKITRLASDIKVLRALIKAASPEAVSAVFKEYSSDK